DATTLTPTYNADPADEGSTVTLTMTVTSTNTCAPQTATATYSVTVDAQPTASAGGSETICSNGNATVSGATASNGSITWTHDGSGILSDATTLTPTYNADPADEGSTVTLTMTVTSTNTCAPQTATATYSVIVDAQPTASAGGSETICSNGNATVSGATASNGSIAWTDNGSGSLTDATTLTPTYNADPADEGSTVTLTMTVTSTNTCAPQTATATYSVTVDPQPTASAGGSETICPEEQVIVSGASAANGSILWTHNGNGTLSNETTITPTYLSDASDTGSTVTLTLTVSGENACSTEEVSDIFTITINELPTAPVLISSDMNNFCEDDAGTMNLSVSAGSGDIVRWFDDVCGGNEIGTGNVLNINTPTNSTTYFARWENSCGASDCASKDITVAEPPVIPTSAESDINDFCADHSGNIELSINGGSGNQVQWFSGSCGVGSVGIGNPLSMPSPDVTTTYYARWENACGATSCVEHTVNVNPLPSAPSEAISDRNDFCTDDAENINLSVNGGSGDEIHWYTNACGGTAIGTGNPLTIASPESTITYFARWENTCGVSSCEFVTVNVLELPQVPTHISSDANNICFNNTGDITLSAVGGSGDELVWYADACGTTQIGNTNPLIIESPAVTTEYFARWENSCGASDCESILINIIDSPTDPTLAEVDYPEVCANDDGNISLSITGGEGTTVAWYSDSCGGTPVGTGNPLSIESPNNSKTYFARYESSCGISNCVSVDVSVIALPTPPTNATVDINNICSDNSGTMNLSLEGGSGETVNWYTDACEGTYVGSGNPLEIETPTTTTTYYGQYANNCDSTVCQNVTVNIIPAADATINPVDPFCEGDSPVVITAAESGGTWSGTGIDSNTGFFDPEVAGIGNHIITYTITGDCGDTDQITVSVLENFDATITTVDPLCENDAAITLSAADEGGVWSGDGITDTDNGIFDPMTAGPGNHDITYNYDGDCGDTDNITITVNPAADATINPVDPFCEGDSPVVITAAESGGTWSGTGIDSNTGFFDPEVAGIGDHIITYTITGDCGDTDQITVSVLENFDATIKAEVKHCIDDPIITLTANSEGGVWSGNGITDSIAGTFDPAMAEEGAHQIIYYSNELCGDADTVVFTVYPRANAEITLVDALFLDDEPIQLETTDSDGIWAGNGVDELGLFDPSNAGIGEHQIIYSIDSYCPDTDSISIIVNPEQIPELEIFNVITPNSDGYNDTWKIDGIQAFESVNVNIFNRWGSQIYHFEGTGNAYYDVTNQWDGKHNGKLLPMGNYVYVISLDDNTYKGTITLIY
ncbi:MAG: gliding motility-associated C-terminal domain-containing protein, partial [Bacteroidota bacterium]|nr:gliding motility-associated C-terminal domain-containing protein [Bacteroidota bacterium]